jgi:hypothetical protein
MKMLVMHTHFSGMVASEIGDSVFFKNRLVTLFLAQIEN